MYPYIGSLHPPREQVRNHDFGVVENKVDALRSWSKVMLGIPRADQDMLGIPSRIQAAPLLLRALRERLIQMKTNWRELEDQVDEMLRLLPTGEEERIQARDSQWNQFARFHLQPFLKKVSDYQAGGEPAGRDLVSPMSSEQSGRAYSPSLSRGSSPGLSPVRSSIATTESTDAGEGSDGAAEVDEMQTEETDEEAAIVNLIDTNFPDIAGICDQLDGAVERSDAQGVANHLREAIPLLRRAVTLAERGALTHDQRAALVSAPMGNIHFALNIIQGALSILEPAAEDTGAFRSRGAGARASEGMEVPPAYRSLGANGATPVAQRPAAPPPMSHEAKCATLKVMDALRALTVR